MRRQQPILQLSERIGQLERLLADPQLLQHRLGRRTEGGKAGGHNRQAVLEQADLGLARDTGLAVGHEHLARLRSGGLLVAQVPDFVDR